MMTTIWSIVSSTEQETAGPNNSSASHAFVDMGYGRRSDLSRSEKCFRISVCSRDHMTDKRNETPTASGRTYHQVVHLYIVSGLSVLPNIENIYKSGQLHFWTAINVFRTSLRLSWDSGTSEPEYQWTQSLLVCRNLKRTD